MPSVQRGIALALLATACFSVLDLSAKLMTQQLNVIEIVWGRYVFNFLWFLPLLVSGRKLRRLAATRHVWLHLARAFLLVGSTFCFWLALSHLPLALAVTIGFISPLIVTILSIPILGERVGIHRWGAVIVGLIGVVVIVRPGGVTVHWAVFLPILTAICYALYQILTRIVSRTDDSLTSLFYVALGGAALTSVAVPFVWIPPTLDQWLRLAWLGFLGTLGHFILIRAVTAAPASVIAPFGYSALIWATILGWLVFGNLPDAWTLAGAALIIASGLYTLHRERKRRAADG